MSSKKAKSKNSISLIVTCGAVLALLAAFFMQFAPNVVVEISSSYVSDVSKAYIVGMNSLYGGQVAFTSSSSGTGDVVTLLGELKFNTANFIGYYLILGAAVLMSLTLVGSLKKLRKLFSFISLGLAVAGAVFCFMTNVFFNQVNDIENIETGIFNMKFLSAWGAIVAGCCATAGGGLSLLNVFVK